MVTFKITPPSKEKIALNSSHGRPSWHIGAEAAPAVPLSPLPSLPFPASPPPLLACTCSSSPNVYKSEGFSVLIGGHLHVSVRL